MCSDLTSSKCVFVNDYYVFMQNCAFLQSYFYNDDMFNFNYAQAKAAVGSYKEAEEVKIISSIEYLFLQYVFHSIYIFVFICEV